MYDTISQYIPRENLEFCPITPFGGRLGAHDRTPRCFLTCGIRRVVLSSENFSATYPISRFLYEKNKLQQSERQTTRDI